MRTNHVKARLAAGEVCRGLWVSIPSVPHARLLARQPADWLMLDAEHGPFDVPTLAGMIAAILDARGPAPMVRLAGNTGESVKQALDAGAWGVIAPMISTAAEAAALVAAARYPPAGSRGFGSLWAPLAYDVDVPTYIRISNDETLVGVQIETVQALQNLDAIFSTPGVDLAFVGPTDLSIAMGLAPITEQPAPVFAEAMTYILQTAGRHKLPVGMFCTSGAAAAQRIAQGFQFVNVGSDLNILQRGIAAELAASQP